MFFTDIQKKAWLLWNLLTLIHWKFLKMIAIELLKAWAHLYGLIPVYCENVFFLDSQNSLTVHFWPCKQPLTKMRYSVNLVVTLILLLLLFTWSWMNLKLLRKRGNSTIYNSMCRGRSYAMIRRAFTVSFLFWMNWTFKSTRCSRTDFTSSQTSPLTSLAIWKPQITL